jgi:hypothetical protein
MLIVATNIITINMTIILKSNNEATQIYNCIFDDRFSVKHRSCMLMTSFPTVLILSKSSTKTSALLDLLSIY